MLDNKKKLIIAGAVLGVLAIVAIVVNLSSSNAGDSQAVEMAEKAATQPIPDDQPAARDPGPPVSAGGGRRANP